MNPCDMTNRPYCSGSAPFPKHVLRFLHGGKVINLVDHRGVQLDFQADRYRSILSDIDDKFRREHFSCGQLPLSPAVSPTASPKPLRKAKRIPTTILSANPLQALPPNTEIADFSPVSSTYDPEMSTSPPQPSQELLHFLHSSSHKQKPPFRTVRKAYSLTGSPKSLSTNASLIYQTRRKRLVPRFPMPTVTRRCLGVGQDRRLGLFRGFGEGKKTRISQSTSCFNFNS